MAHIRALDPSRPRGPQRIDVKRTIRGEQVRRSYTRETLAEAQICAAAAELDLDRGVDPDERYRVQTTRAGTTLADWAALWRVGRPGENWAGHLDNHILPMLGRHPLDGDGRLSRLHVQRWVEHLDDVLMPRSIRTVYGTLRTLLYDAIDEPSMPISTSPCVRIRLPPVEPTGRRALTPVEVAAICSRFGTHKELAWTVAFTGARISELLARDVTDWSPMAGLTIPPAGRRRRGEAVRKRGGKTPAAIRTMGLCGSHRALLKTYIGDRSSGPLFLNRDKARTKYDAFLHRLQAAASDAGLPEVTPHWFRHTVKTWLREGGCDPVAVDEHLGHRTAGMDGIYVHVTPAMRSKILDVLEDRWVAAHPTAGPVRAARPAAGGGLRALRR